MVQTNMDIILQHIWISPVTVGGCGGPEERMLLHCTLRRTFSSKRNRFNVIYLCDVVLCDILLADVLLCLVVFL